MKVHFIFAVTLLLSGTLPGASFAADLTEVNTEKTANNDSAIETSQPLQGKRLFFDERARTAMVNDGSQPARIRVVDEKLVAGEVERDKRASIQITVNRSRPSSPTVAIRYDALIEGANSLRFIINGVPCERMEPSRRATTAVRRIISCLSIDHTDIELTLLEDGKSIRVLKDTVEAGVLIPGSTL